MDTKLLVSKAKKYCKAHRCKKCIFDYLGQSSCALNLIVFGDKDESLDLADNLISIVEEWKEEEEE